jgi:hypothetical protein
VAYETDSLISKGNPQVSSMVQLLGLEGQSKIPDKIRLAVINQYIKTKEKSYLAQVLQFLDLLRDNPDPQFQKVARLRWIMGKQRVFCRSEESEEQMMYQLVTYAIRPI